MAVAENNTKKPTTKRERNQRQINIFRRKIQFEAQARSEMRRGADRKREDKHRRREDMRHGDRNVSFSLRASPKKKTQKNSQISTYHREENAKSDQRGAAPEYPTVYFDSNDDKANRTIGSQSDIEALQSNDGALCDSR